MYKATPYTGANVGMNITTPAGAKLGAVAIDQASVNKLNLGREAAGSFPKDVFELVQCGENTWTLRFKDGAIPVQLKASGKDKGKPVKNANGSYKAAANKTYSVKIELWAEGTYVKNADGSPKLEDGKIVPLYNGAKKPSAKTKPTPVTVKVNLK